jgi:hypothetical protein
MAPVSRHSSVSISSRISQDNDANELQKLRDKVEFDSNCDSWCNTIRNNVGKQFFHVRQFISSPADEEYESNWQKIICDYLKVPPEHCEAFWNRKSKNGGKTCARSILNRRRMNVTNAVKKKFEGKPAARKQ